MEYVCTLHVVTKLYVAIVQLFFVCQHPVYLLSLVDVVPV
jgi:hypothetical protein